MAVAFEVFGASRSKISNHLGAVGVPQDGTVVLTGLSAIFIRHSQLGVPGVPGPYQEAWYKKASISALEAAFWPIVPYVPCFLTKLGGRGRYERDCQMPGTGGTNGTEPGNFDTGGVFRTCVASSAGGRYPPYLCYR